MWREEKRGENRRTREEEICTEIKNGGTSSQVAQKEKRKANEDVRMGV